MTRINREYLPPALAARPWDDKRGLPIPYMNLVPADLDTHAGALPGDEGVEFVADFTAIYAPTVYKCAIDRLCGICAEPLGYWVAFMGGPKSFQNRIYQDPPFCESCVEWATRLCPHILIPRHRRAPEHRVSQGTSTAPGFDPNKAEEWVMGITRDFKVETRGAALLLRPAPFKRSRRFGYVEGRLVETTPVGAGS